MKVPSHRTRGRLTLEQFREAKQQYGIREMPKALGVGKNHVRERADQGTLTFSFHPPPLGTDTNRASAQLFLKTNKRTDN